MATVDHMELERLRRHYAKLEEDASPTTDCPDPEELWAVAAEGRTGAGDTIDHLLGCPACREAWRLARQLMTAPAVPATRATRSRMFSMRWAGLALAAAATAVLGIVAVQMFLSRPLEPVSEFRDGAEQAIRSLVPPGGQGLPRSAFTLSWTPGAAGALYSVQVTTRDLRPVAGAFKLQTRRFTIPEQSLEDLAAGTALLWQVESLLPDGTRISSPTFVTELQDEPQD